MLDMILRTNELQNGTHPSIVFKNICANLGLLRTVRQAYINSVIHQHISRTLLE